MKPIVRTGPKRLRRTRRDSNDQRSRWMNHDHFDKHERQRMRDRADHMAERAMSRAFHPTTTYQEA